jgi:type II secretory pathway pseudopilin PulG
MLSRKIPNHLFTKKIQSGMTFLELLLSLLITSIVMASFLLFSKSFMFSTDEFKGDIYAQLVVRSLIDQLQFHSSQAGFSPIDSQLGNSITAEIRPPIWFNPADAQNDVSAIQFTFDTSNLRRDYALYEVLSLPRNGRAESGIYLTRSYKTSSSVTMFTQQLVIAGVKSFICTPSVVTGFTRLLNCSLEVYKTVAPNTDYMHYDFTLATAQNF